MLVSRLENLVSDRRLIEHCSLRLDILYLLGYELDEDLPWHSTVSRTRQLYPAPVFEQLFDHVFAQCVAAGLVTATPRRWTRPSLRPTLRSSACAKSSPPTCRRPRCTWPASKCPMCQFRHQLPLFPAPHISYSALPPRPPVTPGCK